MESTTRYRVVVLITSWARGKKGFDRDLLGNDGLWQVIVKIERRKR
jgi:hypothetical protein